MAFQHAFDFVRYRETSRNAGERPRDSRRSAKGPGLVAATHADIVSPVTFIPSGQTIGRIFAANPVQPTVFTAVQLLRGVLHGVRLCECMLPLWVGADDYRCGRGYRQRG
jgi:hypothetical protein